MVRRSGAGAFPMTSSGPAEMSGRGTGPSDATGPVSTLAWGSIPGPLAGVPGACHRGRGTLAWCKRSPSGSLTAWAGTQVSDCVTHNSGQAVHHPSSVYSSAKWGKEQFLAYRICHGDYRRFSVRFTTMLGTWWEFAQTLLLILLWTVWARPSVVAEVGSKLTPPLHFWHPRQKPGDLQAITEGKEAQIALNLSFYLSALVSAGPLESERPRRAEFWAVQFEKGYRNELVLLCCFPDTGGPSAVLSVSRPSPPHLSPAPSPPRPLKERVDPLCCHPAARPLLSLPVTSPSNFPTEKRKTRQGGRGALGGGVSKEGEICAPKGGSRPSGPLFRT